MVKERKMFTEKDIYSALDLIRRICEHQKDCSGCPFCLGGCCTVNNDNVFDAPCNWELTPPPEPSNWHPFE